MIAPLRRRHQSLILAATVVTLLGMLTAATAWTSRPDAERLGGDTSSWTAVSWDPSIRDSDLEDPDLTVRLARRREGGGRRILLRLGRDLNAPDLLLYWAPRRGEGQLPADAVLLGPLDGSGTLSWNLPASHMPGVLVFYSHGHGESILTLRVAEIHTLSP